MSQNQKLKSKRKKYKSNIKNIFEFCFAFLLFSICFLLSILITVVTASQLSAPVMTQPQLSSRFFGIF